MIPAKQATLTALVTPDSESGQTVTWSTSNSTVASVTAGVVTANAAGTATITAAAAGKTATCTVTVLAAFPTAVPVTAWVLDSVGGSSISGATVSAADLYGDTAVTGTTNTYGTATLSLVPGVPYTVTATASGTAGSAMAGFLPASAGTVALYCHTLGISGAAAQAPTLESVEYSTNGTNWYLLSDGATVGGAFQIRASVLGVVAVKATSWSGFGIGINIDQMPSTVDGYTTSSSLVSTITDSVLDSATNEYRTVDLFNLSSRTFLPGSHTLDLVAYDVANNRVERRIGFTLE